MKTALDGVVQKEIELRNSVTEIVGGKGLRKLTKKNFKGCPFFTELITDLYKYLIQFYERPGYNIYRSDRNPKRAIYPQELLKVITDLLKVYYPSYFKEFTPNNVKARVKFHAR